MAQLDSELDPFLETYFNTLDLHFFLYALCFSKNQRAEAYVALSLESMGISLLLVDSIF